MRLDLDNLPSDMILLHGPLRDMAAVVERRDGEIERLRTIIKQLQRVQFGRRSERLDLDQLALALEDLDSDIGRAEAGGRTGAVEIADKRPRRKPLADHLPCEEVVIDVANDACPCRGGVLHSIGESVSEMLVAGSDGDAKHWIAIASPIETCKLIEVELYRYLAHVIIRIVNGHPQSRLDELLP